MSYIGANPQTSLQQYLTIDDISGDFDGIETSFALLVGGVAPVPGPSQSNQLLISLGGVIQEPDDTGSAGFRLSGGNIIFSSAPAGSTAFFGVALAGADYIYAGTNFPDGSVTTPSITFANDLDSGFFRSGSGELAYTANGTFRLKIDSSGRVGVGTSSPGVLLDIQESNTDAIPTDAAVASAGLLKAHNTNASAVFGGIGLQARSSGSAQWLIGTEWQASNQGDLFFRTRNGSTTSAERLRITNAGNVGVGTTSPDSTLELASGPPSFKLTRNTTASTGNDFGRILFENSAGTTLGSIRGYSENGNTDLGLKFSTGTGDTIALTIDESQRVGIGTASPQRELHVQGATNGTIRVQAANNATSQLLFSDSDAEIRGRVGYFHSDDALDFYSAGQERMRIDSAGRLLVGTSTSRNNWNDSGIETKIQIEGAGDDDSAALTIVANSGTTSSDKRTGLLVLGRTRGTTLGSNTAVVQDDAVGMIEFKGSDGTNFTTAATIRAQVDGSIGTDDMPGRLVFSTTADGASSPTERLRIDSKGQLIHNGLDSSLLTSLNLYNGTSGGNNRLLIRAFANGGGDPYIMFDAGGSDMVVGHLYGGGTSNKLILGAGTTPSNANGNGIAVDGNGSVYIQTTSLSSSNDGCYFNSSTNTSFHQVLCHSDSNANNAVLYINRQNNDGQLVQFRHADVAEGNISVSGSTVSYNGAHLSRWSQPASGADFTGILRGSVLSNTDEMCVWDHEAQQEVLYTDEDEALLEGASVGDVKTPAKAAFTEENEQLNRMKISDVEGDKNVAGIFDCFDGDEEFPEDFYCAMTGDFIIRIAQGVTVERGDLLMSAGDGTAKPQDDDIIRSKTIAKVTSTNVSCTYDDGSYCVPCVLMAC